jgi:PEP-CTERM motif
MFIKFSWLGIGVFAVASAVGTSSYASSIDFGSCAQVATSGVVCPNNDSGKSQIKYTNGGLSVTMTGFLNGGSRENLYIKNGGSGETGLGTMIDPDDHEITADDFVNIDVSNLWANGISSAQLTIESLQAGEDFKLCQGSVLGSMGGNCVTGGQIGNTADTTVNISWGASNTMFGIQGYGISGADVLVDGIAFNAPIPPPPPVPEPTSLLLFGSGLVALAVKRKRVPERAS